MSNDEPEDYGLVVSLEFACTVKRPVVVEVAAGLRVTQLSSAT